MTRVAANWRGEIGGDEQVEAQKKTWAKWMAKREAS